MKLSTIAKNILKEEITAQNGANPADASSSPVPSAPDTNQPSEATKYYDVLSDFQTFETTVDKQVEAAKKNLVAMLSKNLLNKTATVRASKGAVGQIQKDYTVTVTGLDVSYMNDEYYVVVKDKDKKDYFVNPAFKIKVGATSTEVDSQDSPEATNVTPPQDPSKDPGVGQRTNMAYPQTMGLSSPANIGRS